jgi:hypothetical protein
MDWQNNRLYIAAAALLVLGGLAFYLVRHNTGDTVTTTTERPTLPHIERDDVTALDITRPGTDGAAPEHVRLERHDDHWFVTQPIEAPADPSAIDTALEKLGDLEVAGLAASHAEHHAELEVDDGHGVHVVVHGANDETLADLIVGAFRSGNTMVRAGGQDTVVTVRGSIRFAFSKDLKDWRDRGMLDVEADHVRAAEWVGPNGTFRFQRPEVAAAPSEPPAEGEEAPAPAGPTLGDWQPVEVSYVPAVDTDAGVAPPAAPLTTLEHYAASRVTSMISSLAHMRASDFAAADVTREGAGITASSPRVTIEVVENGTPTRRTITLGGTASEGNFFATRDGDDTIFIISRFLSERVSPTAASFTEAAPAPAPSEDEAPPMPGGAGGLPPELMEQLQRQLQAQGLGGP